MCNLTLYYLVSYQGRISSPGRPDPVVMRSLLVSVMDHSCISPRLHKHHLFLLLLAMFIFTISWNIAIRGVLPHNKNRSIWVEESENSAHLSFLLHYAKKKLFSWLFERFRLASFFFPCSFSKSIRSKDFF